MSKIHNSSIEKEDLKVSLFTENPSVGMEANQEIIDIIQQDSGLKTAKDRLYVIKDDEKPFLDNTPDIDPSLIDAANQMLENAIDEVAEKAEKEVKKQERGKYRSLLKYAIGAWLLYKILK